jgi:hypothetical protein
MNALCAVAKQGTAAVEALPPASGTDGKTMTSALSAQVFRFSDVSHARGLDFSRFRV